MEWLSAAINDTQSLPEAASQVSNVVLKTPQRRVEDAAGDARTGNGAAAAKRGPASSSSAAAGGLPRPRAGSLAEGRPAPRKAPGTGNP